jgi:nucleotide-binding universal stress UspA family protein
VKIVLGVDDSPCSQRAIEWLAGVPWPQGTRVTVVSAARPLVGAYVDVVVPASAWSQDVQEEQLRFHAEVAGRAADKLSAAGLATDEAAPLGDPREVLCELARTLRADLVVVGSHGRTGVSRLVLGSVASHVVTHAPCTVVVVKDHGQPEPGAKPDQGR